MWLVQHHRFNLDKDATTGSLVRHVAGVLDAHGLGDTHVGFFGRNNRDMKQSMCDRLVKARPELADFAVAGVTVPTLSNLAPPWFIMSGHSETPDLPIRSRASGRPIARDVLLEIADGVPKRFALHESHFMFGPIAALQLSATAPVPRLSTFHPVDVELPYIVVDSAWWTPRRDLALGATVIMDAPALDAKTLPTPPPATDALLRDLAKIGRAKTTQTLVASDEERGARRDDVARADAIAEAFKAGLDPKSLPHALGHPGGYMEQHGSLKEPVAAQLKPLGYKSRAARAKGVLHFIRRTSAHNVIVVEIDRTPIAAELRLHLSISGPLWRASASWLPVSSMPARKQVHTEEECRAAADNIATIVQRFETEVAAPVDALMGPGARWFEATP